MDELTLDVLKVQDGAVLVAERREGVVEVWWLGGLALDLGDTDGLEKLDLIPCGIGEKR